jgi:hypothetical protein
VFARGFLRWVGALLVWGAWLEPSPASAAELTWHAPESCARAETVREQVGKLVGRRFEAIEGIAFEIAISAEGDGRHVLVLRTVFERTDGTPSAPRERTLEGASCAEVSDAASVAIALAIAEREEERARQEAPPEAAAPPTSPSSVEPAVPDDRTPIHVSLGAGALVESGALPAVALGAQVEASLGYGAVRAALFGALFASQSGALPDDDSGARFDFVLGGLAVCGESTLSAAFDLIACAGMELGRLAAEGENVRRRDAGEVLWYAPRVDLGAFYGLTDRLRLGLRAGAAIPLARPEFVLNDRDRVHQPANVSARLLIGLELRF